MNFIGLAVNQISFTLGGMSNVRALLFSGLIKINKNKIVSLT